MKFNELAELKAKVQKMKGEIEFIKGEHKSAKEKFMEVNGDITTNDL
jgi:peptidoglycan hydrolase CwlO-like protein